MAEGAVIANLVDMLTGFLRDGVSPILRVREQFEPLCVELKAIHCFLKDMDGKEGKNSSVKNWLTSVRDVAYEAEGLIEEFMIEGQKFAPFRAPLIYNSYGKRIEKIKTNISQLVELRKKYVSNLSNPSKGLVGTSSHVGSACRRTSSFLNNDPIVGFGQHTSNLMKVLLSPEKKLQKIVITGMGGVGKTTLASVLYNEAHKVEESRTATLHMGGHRKESSSSTQYRKHFDCFAWVTIGIDPDIPALSRVIVTRFGVSFCSEMLFGSENRLVSPDDVITYLSPLLLDALSEMRYLVVFDDVWSLDVCSQLIQAFPDGENGSRIILTSRQKDFPSWIIADLFMYELKPINEDESWQLFLHKAFPQSNQQNGSTCPEELEDLGRELCKRCYGLPLALVVLGGLVCRKGKHPAIWIDLLESLNWVSTKDGQECLDILALSYWDLPYDLKPCFLYLGAFRPDSDISTSKLIKVWAGDGLILKREERTLEEVGFEYLDELILRCMVQVAIRGSDNRVKRIRVHGLLNELALSEARDNCFLHVSKECDGNMLVPGRFHRRVAFHSDRVDFPIKDSSGKLRALLAFVKIETSKKITVGGIVTKPYSFYHIWASRLLDFPLIRTTPKALMYIRVLELEGVSVKDNQLEFLEDSMVHLRYLGLRNTNLKEFPFSKCNLQFLQTLDVRGTSIKTLPAHIWTNKALEHMYLNSISPPSITGLRGLQTLVGALCSEWIARGLSSLTNVRYLKMQLVDIYCGDEVINSLRGLSNLMSLKLSGEKIPQEVIGATRNHQRLFKLNLQGKLQPNELPAFEKFAQYLTELTLSGAYLERDPMSTLKQLRSLRVLKLKDAAYVGSQIVCSSGGFSQLQYLKLSLLSNLMFFRVESRALPNLTHLSIHGCLARAYQMVILDVTIAGVEEEMIRVEQEMIGVEHLTNLQVLKLKGGACMGRISVIAEFCQRNNIFLRNKNG